MATFLLANSFALRIKIKLDVPHLESNLRIFYQSDPKVQIRTDPNRGLGRRILKLMSGNVDLFSSWGTNREGDYEKKRFTILV